MFLHEIITEDTATIQPIGQGDWHAVEEDIPHTIEFIKKHCGPWLNATQDGNAVVYRGMRSQSYPFFTKATRTDRRPKDSSPLQQKIFNMLIRENGGTATRENSLFATGGIGHASEYGRPYVILPIGEFHYTWSPIWKDWFIRSVDKFNSLLKDDLRHEAVGPNLFSEKYSALYLDPTSYDPNKVNEAIISDENLLHAIEMKHEILIQCKAAVYVDEGTYALGMKGLF